MSYVSLEPRNRATIAPPPDLRPISLLLRNIRGVFGERDPAVRRHTMREIYLPDGEIAGPDVALLERFGIAGKGYGVIEAAAGRLQGHYPGYNFIPIECATASGRIGCLKWCFGPPNAPAAFRGVDIALCEDGRIKTLCSLREDPRVDQYDVEEMCATLDHLSVEPSDLPSQDPGDRGPRRRVRRAFGRGTPIDPAFLPGRRPFVALVLDQRTGLLAA